MKNFVNKPTFRIALCSITAALSAALMMLTSIIPLGTYMLPCIAGALTVAVVIEYGAKWALGVYAAVAVLSFLMAGDKESVLYFAALFGYYPILKNLIESKVRSKAARYIIKFAVFNAAAIGSFYIATLLLAVPADDFTLFGVYVPYVFLIFGNFFFLVYDFALTSFVILYVRRIRDKLFKIFK